MLQIVVDYLLSHHYLPLDFLNDNVWSLLYIGSGSDLFFFFDGFSMNILASATSISDYVQCCPVEFSGIAKCCVVLC